MFLEYNPALPIVRELFLEYSRQLGIDLCFQNFQHELDGLPDKYECLIVAYEGVNPAGCVGLRPHTVGTAEMKRLYVREGYRGTGLGRRLAVAAIEKARKMGYEILRLDTLPNMRTAIQLYQSLGFREVAALPNPGVELLIFHLNLQAGVHQPKTAYT